MIRLSQAMIVKNEEKNIRRALSWGKGIVSEQIVVDTGSTDRTAEIAGEMGAKVFHFPWAEDFSAAKNYALSKCGGDWVAFLDADEYFPEEDAGKIPLILREIERAHAQAEAVYCSLVNLSSGGGVLSGGSVLRLFRLRGDLRYYRRIHEQIRHPGGETLHVIDCTQELRVLHTGYSEECIREKRERGRNLSMLQKELQENPEDPEILGYLGDEYAGLGKAAQAEEAYRAAIRYGRGREAELSLRGASCYAGLMQLLSADPGREEEFLWLGQEAMGHYPEDADFPYFLGCFYFERKDWEQAQAWLSKALDSYEAHGAMNKALHLGTQLAFAYEMLGDAYLLSGRRQQAIGTAVRLLQAGRELLPALRTLLAAFHGDASAGEAAVPLSEELAFLGKLYDFQNRRDRMLLYRASLDAGDGDLAEALRGYFPPEERALL